MADNKNELDINQIIAEAMSAKQRKMAAASAEDKPQSSEEKPAEKTETEKAPEEEKQTEKAVPASAELPDVKFGSSRKEPETPKVEPVPEEKPAVHKETSPETAEEKPRRRPEGEGAARRPRRENGEERPRNNRPHGAENGEEHPHRSRSKRPDGQHSPVSRTKTAGGAAHKKHDPSKTAREQGAKRSSENGKGKKKKWTKKQITILAVSIVFIVVCLLGLGIYLIFHYYYSLIPGKWNESTTSERMEVSIDDSTQSDTFDPMTEEERIKKQLEDIKIDLMKDQDVYNILLVGQDLRSTADENAQSNTDVMLMLSLNSKNKTITLTSFMRDMWMYIPSCQYSDRLNAAFFAGGPEYLRNTIEAYFGVSIDKYVVVNFNQFIDIVDTLGGLDIYVTPNEANGYYKDATFNPKGDNTRGMQNPLDEQNHILGNPYGTDYIKMDYGEDGDVGQVVHLNGNQALAYSRIRHVDYVDPNNPAPLTYEANYSDFGRTKRQRLVISKIIEKTKGASLVQLNQLAHDILEHIYTDISEGEAASLLLNIFEYMNYDVQDFRIPEEGTYSGHWIKGRSVILCNTIKNATDLQMLVYGSTNIDEEKLKQYAEQNKYYDDNGKLIDYFS